MAMIETNRTAPFGAESIYKGTVFVEGLMNEFRARLAARRIHKELAALPSRQLADIGLGDEDLGAFSLEVARRAL